MKLATLALAAVFFAAPLAAASAGQVRWEAEEPNRNDLEMAGQNNNVVEAYHDRGANPLGFRILDGFYDHMGGVVVPSAGAYVGTSRESSIDQKGNLRRTSDGVAPDLILPGAGRFFAWFGTWTDSDGDGVIRTNPSLPQHPVGSEFKMSHKQVHGWVEPGHRAPATSTTVGSKDTPDFSYHPGTYVMPLHQSGGITPYDLTIFLDGSLLQAIRVESVSESVLAPSEQGKPYTKTADTLVDIDLYATLGLGPLEGIYAATAGPVVTSVASPNRASCPQNCRFPPIAPPPALSGPIGAVQSLAFPRYGQETDAGSGSTAEGRLAAYQDAFHAWADLVPLVVEPQSIFSPEHTMPLMGRTDDGAPAMLPGYFGYHVWTGLWKDISADGFVGDVGDNPYDDGNRPIPDDYARGFPEFVPVWGRNALNATVGQQAVLKVTYRPIPDWGSGVIVTDRAGVPQAYTLNGGPVIPPEGTPLPRLTTAPNVRDPSVWLVTGDTTLTLRGLGAPVDHGRYYAFDYLYLPRGTDGFAFEVCHEWLTIRHASNGDLEDEPARDCDVIGRLAGT